MSGPHKVSLRETRAGCSIMEREPRYDVLLNGQKVGQLYFNMRGYVGTLPLPNGKKIGLPESGITAWRKEAATINREALANG